MSPYHAASGMKLSSFNNAGDLKSNLAGPSSAYGGVSSQWNTSMTTSSGHNTQNAFGPNGSGGFSGEGSSAPPKVIFLDSSLGWKSDRAIKNELIFSSCWRWYDPDMIALNQHWFLFSPGFCTMKKASEQPTWRIYGSEFYSGLKNSDF